MRDVALASAAFDVALAERDLRRVGRVSRGRQPELAAEQLRLLGAQQRIAARHVRP